MHEDVPIRPSYFQIYSISNSFKIDRVVDADVPSHVTKSVITQDGQVYHVYAYSLGDSLDIVMGI